MRAYVTLLLALILASLSATACAPGNLPLVAAQEDDSPPTVTPFPTRTATLTPAATATPGPSPTASPTPDGWVGPYVYPDGINPLTGLPVADPTLLALRPMAVKISNAPAIVRPQSGIGQADVVFEHYAEGGLTRFTAIFLGNLPRRVGSIRSARLVDVEIPEMFESYLVYAGSSTGVRQRIEAAEFAPRAFYGVEIGPPYYYRDPDIIVPHNLFADLVAIHSLAADLGVNSPPAPHYSSLAFAPEPPAGGTSGQTIDLRYRASGVYYQYDETSGLYERWADGQPHFDATLNRQVTAANVVVLYANHTETDIVESQYQDSVSYSIEVQLWGEGRAVVFRDGQRYEARWARPDRHDMFTLYDEQGSVLRLKPGVTFFQLVPLDFSALTVE